MSAFTRIPMGSRPRLIDCAMAEHGFRGQEEYELPSLWCLHLYFYDVELTLGRGTYHVVPGALTLVPPGTRLIYKYSARRHRHFYVHFAMKGKSQMERVPLFQHLPEARDEILDRLQNMQRVLAHSRAHAEILFWGLLWDVVENGQRTECDGDRNAALIKAIDAFVEARLPDKIMVADLADHLGLSSTHVNRIIKNRLGLTTNQLVRKRRLQRACRLLLHSTMPIKLIAAECGIENLQQFNKLMRHEYGKSPRQWRERRLTEDDSIWAVGRE